MLLPINNTLAKTRPKKKDHNNTGSLSNNQESTLAKDTTLIPIPTKSANKKFPLTWFQTDFIPSVLSFPIKLNFIELIEDNNSS